MDSPAAAAGTWILGDRPVNRLGFGSMRLTVRADRDAAIAVVRRALDLGVDHLDTAAFYVSPGGTIGDRAEPGRTRYAAEIIRDALRPGDDVLIATKVGPGVFPDGFGFAKTADQLRAQVEENLERLGRDRLDVVNLRIVRRSGEDSIAAQFEALARIREEGLISHLGLSNVRADHLDEAAAIAPVVCVQNSYSIDHNRGDDDLIARCLRDEIAFVPFFAIAGTTREEGGKTHDPALSAIAARLEATVEQVRLAWTLHRGPHVLAIPGTGSLAHLEENVAAAAIELSEQDLAELERSA